MGVGYPEEKLNRTNLSILTSLLSSAWHTQTRIRCITISMLSGSRAWATKATAQCMLKTVGTMAKRHLQIALDGADADLKSRGDLMRRLPLD
jgi:hypothetical protein